ncbi:MAG TPA: low-specificity L-threonine aldolase [Dehalococcoidia bacterium]|nr:low-specificity L-threonine aldolase [Dehalococcoidia bacterium]
MSDERVIDLRSDTVTLPSEAMRRAIADAPVGDDVMGEDPTVNRLEEMAAERTGKQAGLFVSSGTMSNLVAIMAQCERGDEAIAGSESHILHYEVASAAGVAGVQLRPAQNDERGRFDPDEVRTLIRGENVHFPRTALLCLENTQNRCGGAVLPQDHIEELAAIAHEHGVRVHIDGARIFNAAVATGTTVADLCAPADSIGFCLSKGLGAPVGSVLCGDAAFVARARKMRKMLGGGMRQAGVIAAAGIYALEQMVHRLAEDHENAKALAQGLAQIPMIELDPETVESNIVIFHVQGDWQEFGRALKRNGVLASIYGERRMRMVTHYGIARADIDEALDRVRDAAAAHA